MFISYRRREKNPIKFILNFFKKKNVRSMGILHGQTVFFYMDGADRLMHVKDFVEFYKILKKHNVPMVKHEVFKKFMLRRSTFKHADDLCKDYLITFFGDKNIRRNADIWKKFGNIF